jgi:hypothetical protein
MSGAMAVVVPSQKAGIGRGVNKRIAELKSALPAADPGQVSELQQSINILLAAMLATHYRHD